MQGSAKSNKTMPVRLLVVDDDHAIMDCVAAKLAQDGTIVVVGLTCHAQAAIPLATQQQADVVLMDIHMPGMDPFDACREITEKSSGQIKVLFYTGFPSDRYLDRCLAVGGAGMVSKHTESMRNLSAAIRHVAAGNTFFSPELADRLVDFEDKGKSSRYSLLTSVEKQMVHFLASGKTQAEVALELDISIRSVNKTFAEIKQKLELENSNQLLLFAIREGIVHPELSFQKSKKRLSDPSSISNQPSP